MAPRRIVTFNWVTADGYFAGADSNLDWVVPDPKQAKAAAESISDFDTVMFGHRTYELFEGFWRHAVVDEFGTIPDPHRGFPQGQIRAASGSDQRSDRSQMMVTVSKAVTEPENIEEHEKSLRRYRPSPLA